MLPNGYLKNGAIFGTTGMIVSDNGTEPTSNTVLAWCGGDRCGMALCRAGKANAKRLRRELQ